MNPAPSPRFQGSRHTARTLALQVLLDSAKPDALQGRPGPAIPEGRPGPAIPEGRPGPAIFVQELLDRYLGSGVGAIQPPLSSPDRRLATQLIYGVLRRKGTLLALVEPLVSRPRQHVEPWLWDTLALGAYQLALLSHIPVHAALHETVELAAQFGRPGAKGFVNGVLRSLANLLTQDRGDSPAANALPVENGIYRKLTKPLFPDPESEPAVYLASGFGLPLWLANRWQDRLGVEEARRLGFWFAGPAPLTLRCNLLRTSREALLLALEQAGHPAEAGGHPQAIRLRDHAPVRELPGYEAGWFSVQDEASMQVASALAPEPGWRVLDLCSAPGGKSTHLAELMRDQGQVIACDSDSRRLQTVGSLVRRLGLNSVRTHPIDSKNPDSLPREDFDAALVDVPCSNTGVLGRRPEVRWRLRPNEFHHLVPLQAGLLRRAMERVKPGGVVVYSTCSIEPEENGPLVRTVLQGLGGWTLEAEMEAVPGKPADGGYWARLRRR